MFRSSARLRSTNSSSRGIGSGGRRTRTEGERIMVCLLGIAFCAGLLVARMTELVHYDESSRCDSLINNPTFMKEKPARVVPVKKVIRAVPQRRAAPPSTTTGTTNKGTTAAADKDDNKNDLYETHRDEYGWPTKTPRELFGSSFDDCRVEFKDETMAACHLAAFGGNFGDMLGPDIVKRVAEYHFGCTARDLRVHDYAAQPEFDDGVCLMTVGSVWRLVKADDHVWGTGVLTSVHELQVAACKGFQDRFNNVTVYSVRGPRTVELLRETCDRRIQISSETAARDFAGTWRQERKLTKDLSGVKAAGDAGFLIPYVFPEYRKAEGDGKKSCVVLHKYDDEKFLNRTLVDARTTLMLPVVQPWRTMAGNMTRHCATISSSSLHGLILADAFGIPARWIGREWSIKPFKFEDYHRSYGITREKLVLFDVLTNPDLEVPETEPAGYRSEYAMRIIESFPFHLFKTVTAT